MANDDIRGTITDSDGNPVQGAVVEVTKAQKDGKPEEQKVIRTTTDSNGDYVIDKHPQADGTSQEWNVTAYYWNGSSWKPAVSRPGVAASLTSGLVIDNFDSSIYEDQNESLSDNYTGSTGNFSRTTSRSYSGSYSLENTSDGGNYTIISTSGLQKYPSQGDKFEIRYYAGTTGEPQNRVLWGVQDSSNYYWLAINNDSADPVLTLGKDGSTLNSTGSGDSTPRSEWQRLLIDWRSDGRMICELYNSNGSPDYSVDSTDTAYTSGGIGFTAGASGSSQSYWDSYKLK